jgi:hypothetical protein
MYLNVGQSQKHSNIRIDMHSIKLYSKQVHLYIPNLRHLCQLLNSITSLVHSFLMHESAGINLMHSHWLYYVAGTSAC